MLENIEWMPLETMLNRKLHLVLFKLHSFIKNYKKIFITLKFERNTLVPKLDRVEEKLKYKLNKNLNRI